MKTRVVPTEDFGFDGRGPSLIRWLYYSDLLFPGTFWSDSPNGIYGAEYGIPPMAESKELPSTTVAVVSRLSCPRAWVVFHGLQVIQIASEEVHSYWHAGTHEPGTKTGVWEAVESEWLASFNSRHLAHHRHFLLEFYDHLVDLVARDLIFGRGKFSIDSVVQEDGRFAYAFLRRAQTNEEAQDWHAAIADYRSYAALEPVPSHANYGLRCAMALEAKLQ